MPSVRVISNSQLWHGFSSRCRKPFLHARPGQVYHAMGIPEIWVVDPETRVFSRFEDGQLIRRTDFFVPSKNISFPVSQIEAMLD